MFLGVPCSLLVFAPVASSDALCALHITRCVVGCGATELVGLTARALLQVLDGPRRGHHLDAPYAMASSLDVL